MGHNVFLADEICALILNFGLELGWGSVHFGTVGSAFSGRWVSPHMLFGVMSRTRAPRWILPEQWDLIHPSHARYPHWIVGLLFCCGCYRGMLPVPLRGPEYEPYAEPPSPP